MTHLDALLFVHLQLFNRQINNLKFFWVSYFSSYFALIPTILGAIKYSNTKIFYRPFYLFIFLSCFVDITGFNLILLKQQNIATVLGNIYVLISSIILLSFFENARIIRRKYIFYILLSFLITVWTLDNLILHKINSTNSFFRIIYSSLTALLSIQLINNHIITYRTNILKEPSFLISIVFILNFSYRSVLESIFLFDLPISNGVYFYTMSIFVFLNLLSNIFYSIAILCIQAKQRFTLSY